MLYYQTAQKSAAFYDDSDLSVWKMKMFNSTLVKAEDNIWNVWESYWNPYNQKESVSCIEVTKIRGKLLVFVILQG